MKPNMKAFLNMLFWLFLPLSIGALLAFLLVYVFPNITAGVVLFFLIMFIIISRIIVSIASGH